MDECIVGGDETIWHILGIGPNPTTETKITMEWSFQQLMSFSAISSWEITVPWIYL